MPTDPMPPDDDRRRRLVGWVLLGVALALALVALDRWVLDPIDDGPALVAPAPHLSTAPSATPSPTPSTAHPPSPTPASSAPTSGGSDGSGGQSAGSGSGSTEGGTPFTMTATLAGGPLVPGAAGALRIQVRNPNSSAIELRTISVTVGSPSAGCQASWLDVGGYDASTGPTEIVDAGGSRTVSVPIELVNLATVDQNACQGATFPLALTGTARQVTG